LRLSKPVYESLPYVYMGLGAGALVFSWWWREPVWSDAIVGLGLVAVTCGVILVLKRRDYRLQKRRYRSALDDD
jgi:hypothetical protein